MSNEAQVRAALAQQSAVCAALGSPFMGQLMGVIAARLTTDTDVGRRVLYWAGDPAPSADNPALRLAGGLHALVLTGADPALAAVYPPATVTDDALWDAVSHALRLHTAPLLAWLDTAPQTNEVRRAAGLVPALHLVARRRPGPLHLWEMGCSAGLNLGCDRFRVTVDGHGFGPSNSGMQHRPDWEGPVPEPGALVIGERRGVDLNPLDPRSPEGQLRLRAYLWPDQPHRRRLTDGALAIAADLRPSLTQADAVSWLEQNLADRPKSGTCVIYHTVAWQYLPVDRRRTGEALIAAAGAAANEAAPLVRIALEADGAQPGAGLDVTTWPGGGTTHLARVDFHGRWVKWTGPTDHV